MTILNVCELKQIAMNIIFGILRFKINGYKNKLSAYGLFELIKVIVDKSDGLVMDFLNHYSKMEILSKMNDDLLLDIILRINFEKIIN